MSTHGECFIVLPPSCVEKTIILGRNSLDAASVGKAQEVIYYDVSAALEGENDGGAKPTVTEDCLRIILQKPEPGIWGGDCGVNERNVCLAITWSADDPDKASGNLLASDIVRYVLATAISASEAVDKMTHFLEEHGAETAKFNFVASDAAEAWHISCVGKLLAAQRLTGSQHRISANGLSVSGESYDKTSSDFQEKFQEVKNIFAANAAVVADWCGPQPAGDSSYTLTSMFDTLRAAAKADEARSATVFVLNGKGISSYWFTATPNAMESVFKPFVFAPNAKISPLTSVTPDNSVTLLHKLHEQRKSAAVENLKTLEGSCVTEVTNYLEEHPAADEELDELMKDCVEAEVKFYR